MKLIYVVAMICVCFTVPCLAQSKQARDPHVVIQEAHISLKKLTAIVRVQTGLMIFDDLEPGRHFYSVSFDGPLSKLVEKYYKPNNIDWEWSGVSFNLVKTSAPNNTIVFTGRVLGDSSKPVEHASITIEKNNVTVVTGVGGDYSLSNMRLNDSITFRADGYRDTGIIITRKESLDMLMKKISITLDSINVKAKVSRKRSSPFLQVAVQGLSISAMNQSLINYYPGSNIFQAWRNRGAGILSNSNIDPGGNLSVIQIRSIGSLNARTGPLTLLDGSILTISPLWLNLHDMDSTWMLKDAPGCTPEGIYGGNGVMAISIKSGRYMMPLQVTLNSNVAISCKPDVYYLSRLPSKEANELYNFFYKTGGYDYLLNNSNRLPVPGSVELMFMRDKGLLTENEFNQKMAQRAQNDIRRQARQYLMRPAVMTHNHLGFEGGTEYSKYYGSLSYDNNRESLRGNNNVRYTGYIGYTLLLNNKHGELFGSFYFVKQDQRQDGIDYLSFPYNDEQLKDDGGQNATQTKELRRSYADTVGQGRLLDWKYNALNELANGNNRYKTYLMIATARFSQPLSSHIKLQADYRYEHQLTEHSNYHSLLTWFTRNLINLYTTPSFERRIPPGDIEDYFSSRLNSQYLDIKSFFAWGAGKHRFNAYIGASARAVNIRTKQQRTYGITASSAINNLGFGTPGPTFFDPSNSSMIPTLPLGNDSIGKYLAAYMGLDWTISNKYTLLLALRKDAANLFGVAANQKGTPFYSVGLTWDINKENFLSNYSNISLLRLRISHGKAGNVNPSVSSQYTLSLLGVNNNNAQVSGVNNPSNENLQWETVTTNNLALDFSGFGRKLLITLELYNKKASGLIAPGSVNSTLGVASYSSNIGEIMGRGIDLTINTRVDLSRNSNWQTFILVSNSTNKLTQYQSQPKANAALLNNLLATPLKGKPLYGLYALPYQGVDPVTGNPIGMLNNKPSTDYNGIASSTDRKDLLYVGSAVPTWFGSIQNSVTLNRLTLSGTIGWKANYYFRKASIDYAAVLSGAQLPHTDYLLRFQHPGDATNVPSAPTAPNANRDYLYRYSRALVARADHIRLQDIRIDYNLITERNHIPWLQSLNLFAVANNVKMIWKSNDYGIDPDYISVMPNPFSVNLGLNVKF